MNVSFFYRPPAFSVEIPLERVEVSVSPSDEPSAKEEEEEEEEEKQDEIEMQIPSSRNFRINRYSSNRVSAKSRLGLIRENHGFHSVKLPRSASPRAHSPEVTLADLQVRRNLCFFEIQIDSIIVSHCLWLACFYEVLYNKLDSTCLSIGC